MAIALLRNGFEAAEGKDCARAFHFRKECGQDVISVQGFHTRWSTVAVPCKSAVR